MGFVTSYGFCHVISCMRIAFAVKVAAPAGHRELADWVPAEWTMERWEAQLDAIGTLEVPSLSDCRGTANARALGSACIVA